MSAQLFCRDLAFSHGPTTVLVGDRPDRCARSSHRCGRPQRRRQVHAAAPARGRTDARAGPGRAPSAVRPCRFCSARSWTARRARPWTLCCDAAPASPPRKPSTQQPPRRSPPGAGGADDRYAAALERFLAVAADADATFAATLADVGLDADDRSVGPQRRCREASGPGSGLPRCWRARPTSCCWTSRPTISTSPGSPDWSGSSWAPTPRW